MENIEQLYSEKWGLLVNRAFTDYASLNADEKTWFNVQCLIDAGCNGGLISYYYNSGANHMDDTIAGLEKLKAFEIYDAVSQINQSVFNGTVSADQNARNEVIDQMNHINDVLLDKLDEQFFKHEEELQSKIFDFVKSVNLL